MVLHSCKLYLELGLLAKSARDPAMQALQGTVRAGPWPCGFWDLKWHNLVQKLPNKENNLNQLVPGTLGGGVAGRQYSDPPHSLILKTHI